MNISNYVIIIPVRNEQEYIEGTIGSIAAQTILPSQVIIVDDGSTDGTPELLHEAARVRPWISVVRRKDRGSRIAGSGVIEAFYAGFETLGNQAWDFLVKLDGDVTFAPDYFARCFAQFAEDSTLGIAGGLICNQVNGALAPESKVDPQFHVRGATKIYRSQCWQALGGLERAPGWDTLDEVKANMLGWSTRTLRDIPILHHRMAGAAYGTWKDTVKNGRANYVAGYHPVFMFVKCISRCFQKPYFVTAFGLWVGFCGGYLTRAWRVEDKALIRYFREQQMRRLLRKKSLWS